MRTLFQDLRYAAWTLLKKPGFVLVAVLTLAIGLGANAVIFSLVNSVLLSPLPYPNPDQLVMIWQKLPTHGLNKLNISPAEYVDYRDGNQSFSAIASYASLGRNLTGVSEPERVDVTFVTRGFFDVLAVQPMHGRKFLDEEDAPGRNQVAILSRDLWHRHFAGDPSAVGKAIVLDGVSHTVVGIMPAGFQFPDQTVQVWKPMAFEADDLSEDNRGSHYLDLIARTKPGVSIQQANADIARIAGQMQQAHPDQYEEGSGWAANVVSLHEEIVGDIRLPLLVSLVVVGFVLLIACTNVANLLLARAASRRREIAIRTALGAGRWHVIRQILAESLLLSLAGGTIGVLIAVWSKDLLTMLNPAGLPRLTEVSLDARVIFFAFALSLITGFVFGLLPALQATRLNLSESLKDDAGKATEGRSRQRLRRFLVVNEMALAMILLVGAGLLIKSLYKLQQVDLGFKPDNLLTLRLSLPQARYKDPQKQRAVFNDLTTKVASLPNVESVGIVNFLALSGSGNRRNISVEGKPENPTNAEFRISNPDYFKAIRSELRAGRVFDDYDRESTTYVTVVNDSFVRIFMPNENPLGKRIKMGGLDSPFRWLSIVGVIKDIKHYGPDNETRPEMYIPYQQPPLPDWNVQSMFLAVRTKHEPLASLSSIRDVVKTIDREQPVYSVATMEQLLSKSTAPRRFNMMLMTVFSGLALILASIGIYGVLSYSVAQRTREIGIRMALGARAANVVSLVLRDGITLVLIGIGIGVAASLALTRLMSQLLFEVEPTDLTTFVGVAALLVFVALLACGLPARRAAKVDPLVALRYE